MDGENIRRSIINTLNTPLKVTRKMKKFKSILRHPLRRRKHRKPSVGNTLSSRFCVRKVKPTFERDPKLEELRALSNSLELLHQVESKLHQLSANIVSDESAVYLLKQISTDCDQLLWQIPNKQTKTRAFIIETKVYILRILRVYEVGSKRRVITRVVIPTDLFSQMEKQLFPAERMLVVAGRNIDDRVLLGDVFDVTGDSSSGHVRAEPDMLARALIAMDESNTHLAAWIHSHPGDRPECTRPSSIDIQQYFNLLKHYSPDLIGGIFVMNRYLRLWGTAVENRHVQIEFLGEGIHKVDKNEQIYQLA